MKGVLITRPEPWCSDEAQVLQAQGIEAYALPALALVPIEATFLYESSVDIVIVTSQNAVTFAHPKLLSQLKRAVEHGIIIAMGNATAQALLKAGMGAQIVVPPGGTSEWILALPDMQDMHGQSCVLLTGQQGRGLLQRVLQQRGAQLSVCEVYARICPNVGIHPWKQLRQNIDVISVTSYEAAKNLFHMVPLVYHDWLFGCRIIVPSERVKQSVVEHLHVHLQNCLVANGAPLQSLLEVIRQHDA